MVWAQEGYLLATIQAYVGITPRSLPSDTYLENAEVIVHQQIVLAGMRLAKVLNPIGAN